MRKLITIFVLLISFIPSFSMDSGYFKLSLWEDSAISLPLNNQEITGVDLGLGSATEVVTGLQVDLVFAHTQYELMGLSTSLLVSLANEMTGAQIALLNESEIAKGVQLGFLNIGTNTFTGAQIGIVNQAEYLQGIQIGILNYAKVIEGLQIGGINLLENGWLPAMVFINGRF